MVHETSHRPAKFATGTIATVALAHFAHDVFTAFPAPLLPLIIEKLGLNLVRAGGLLVLIQLPSLANPLLGSWTDRGSLRRLFVAIGPGATGTLVCLIGVAPSYAALSVILLAAGCSVAVIHISAPPLIRGLAGNRIGRGMSFFMVGGELARTVGPIVAVHAVSVFGLEGMWRIAPVALAASCILWIRLRGVAEPPPATRPVGLLAVWHRMRRTLIAVAGILIARSFMVGSLTGFLPTFLYGGGQSLWLANVSLSLLELGGVVGAFASGTLSDRTGRRGMLVATVALSPLLMLAFLFLTGPFRLPLLVVLGVACFSTTPVLLAIVVENAGADPAAATGTFMMLNFAARSLIMLAVGALGDAVGLERAFWFCAALAALGLPFVFVLPRSPANGPVAGVRSAADRPGR